MKTDTPALPAQPLDVLAIPEALLKLRTVTAVTGLSRATIYRRMADGAFCKPVKLGTRCTRWRAADVRAWLMAQGTGVAA